MLPELTKLSVNREQFRADSDDMHDSALLRHYGDLMASELQASWRGSERWNVDGRGKRINEPTASNDNDWRNFMRLTYRIYTRDGFGQACLVRLIISICINKANSRTIHEDEPSA